MTQPIPNVPPPKRLDFSEFHPLDHRPGTAECRNYPGGVRRHVQYEWHFRTGPRIRSFLGRHTLCHVGRHDPEVWFRGGLNPPSETATWCGWCGATLSPWRPISPEEHEQGEIR